MPRVLSVFGVEPVRIGGTETFARELSLQLGDLGWRSTLCFLGEPAEKVRAFLNLSNIEFDVLENSTNGSWTARTDLWRLVRKYRPEILHLHFVSFLTLYPWLARAGGVEKIFFTDHHSRPANYAASAAPRWKRIAARSINWPLDRVVCVSQYGYECMTALKSLPVDRFELIYNGVDLSRVTADRARAIQFRQRYAIPDERKIVAQVSWLIPEKGIDDFLAVARAVITQNANVQFVLIGDGRNREQYVKDAAALGISDHVTFTGMVDDPFGRGVYDAADVVCQFSRWEEVFGWMIAEAMAHAKPVVATRVGGIPELIIDGATGYLVSRGAIHEMAERLLKLLGAPDECSRMGAAGREVVLEKFNLKTNIAQLIRSYGLS